MCSLMAFGLRTECHVVNNLDIVKVKFVIVLNGMLG